MVVGVIWLNCFRVLKFKPLWTADKRSELVMGNCLSSPFASPCTHVMCWWLLPLFSLRSPATLVMDGKDFLSTQFPRVSLPCDKRCDFSRCVVGRHKFFELFYLKLRRFIYNEVFRFRGVVPQAASRSGPSVALRNRTHRSYHGRAHIYPA